MHSCFRFLHHDWKSKNISVPPGHRVILSQFIEKIKQKIMLTSTNTCKRDAKRAEVRCKYSKRVKVEESEDDHGISHDSTMKYIHHIICLKKLIKFENKLLSGKIHKKKHN